MTPVETPEHIVVLVSRMALALDANNIDAYKATLADVIDCRNCIGDTLTTVITTLVDK